MNEESRKHMERETGETPAGDPESVGPEAVDQDRDAAIPEAPAPPASEPAVDYKDRWLRTEAELQTYRRRARREIDDARRGAEESALLDLVGWLDDLERAIQAANEAGASPSWVTGVELVLQKGRESLERQGVTPVDPIDLPFDPHFHEAILEVDPPAGSAPGTVVQVVHKGWRRGARALRPARVVVARSEASGV